MIELKKLIEQYHNNGLTAELAEARVSQDIILKAIENSESKDNITIKGGVIMRSITKDIRRATRDIDLDFIHYSLSDESIKAFINRINMLDGVEIELIGDIQELKHQDYHGKCIHIKITDGTGYEIESKMDIGVHNHLDVDQELYCFDVCLDDNKVSLLKNTVEQIFVEKLRSLLVWGSNSTRFKDICDLYYLKGIVDKDKLKVLIRKLIFDDTKMRENDFEAIVKRVQNTFDNQKFVDDANVSNQKWIDVDIKDVGIKIIDYIHKL